MALLKYIRNVVLVFSMLVSIGNADFTSNVAAGIVQGLFQGSQTQNYSKKQAVSAQRKRYSKKKYKSSIPANCSSAKWSSQAIGNKIIASNFQGITVTFNDMGDLIVLLDIKTPLPSLFQSGDRVTVDIKFNKGNRSAAAVLSKDSKQLELIGLDAVYVISKLKAATYVQIEFINNKYCTRLKGSSNAITVVESAALVYKRNKPDTIDNARVKRATKEHAEHGMRVASNQKEFSEKLMGIRPKSDLDAADGNIYETKIQYYIPGSEEIGEMWVNWFIDDDKGPMMRLNFMDPTHQYENKAYEIDISLEPIEFPCNTDINTDSNKNTSPSCQIVKDLLRADRWGKIAKEKELKRRYKKLVSYIQGDEKSKISLSIYFQVYENGAMSAQLVHKKYGFPKRFNFTLANALELARYIENTREKAQKKWFNQTRTKEDLDALFH
jgi:hypothetical protein